MMGDNGYSAMVNLLRPSSWKSSMPTDLHQDLYEYSLPHPCWLCSFWLRVCLFISNGFVWVAALIFVGVGSWIQLEKSQLGSFYYFSPDPAVFLILSGSAMFLLGFVGCLGALRENICLLKLFGVLLSGMLVLGLVAGSLAFVYMNDIEMQISQLCQRAVQRYEDDPELKKAMDLVQDKLHCCGVTSYADWEVNIYYNCSSIANTRCGVPYTCCREPSDKMCGYDSRQNGEPEAGKVIYTIGCLNKLVLYIEDKLFITGLVAFAVAFLQLFAVLLGQAKIKDLLFLRSQAVYEQQLRMHVSSIYDDQ